MTSSTSDEAIWSQIRDNSFQMVLLTQRADDFWAIPTTRDEAGKTWAPDGTLDAALRKRERFGHPSITVTFNALTALAAASGSPAAWAAPTALRAIESYRGKHGGYGTPVARKDGNERNAVPRHTAMAIVTNLIFSREIPSALNAHLRSPIEWLLKNQLRLGGWPYDRSDPASSLGFLSTSSAICALCLYLDREPGQGRLDRSAKRAITKAYDALIAIRHLGVWDGDGSPPDSQIVNSAFALRLLCLADREGRLSSLVSEHSCPLNRLVAEFSRTLLEGGWPDRVGEEVVRPVSSISGLQLVLATGNPAGLNAGQLRAVEQTILRSWKGGELPLAMEAWDWECLALLASAKIGPMSSQTEQLCRRRCSQIRSRWLTDRITRRDIRYFHGNVDLALHFVLSGGDVLPRHVFIKYGRKISRKVVDDLLVRAIIWILAGLSVYALYASSKTGLW
jgi:hypothetical protein